MRGFTYMGSDGINLSLAHHRRMHHSSVTLEKERRMQWEIYGSTVLLHGCVPSVLGMGGVFH